MKLSCSVKVTGHCEKLTRVITVFKPCSRCLKLQLTVRKTALMPTRFNGSSSRILHLEYNILERNNTRKFITVVPSLYDNIPVTIWSCWKEIMVSHHSLFICETSCFNANQFGNNCSNTLFYKQKIQFLWCKLLYISFICHSSCVCTFQQTCL